jgi:flagellar assembly factor FliW
MNAVREGEVQPTEQLRIHSERFGEFTVPSEQVLTLQDGLIGFPDHRRFVVMEHPTPSLLRWLLCVDEPNLAFAVADPADFFPTYQLGRHEEIEALGVESADDLAVFTIVTIPGDPAAMSANLMAPVVVNVRTRMGRQVILENGLYSTRHRLLQPSGR